MFPSDCDTELTFKDINRRAASAAVQLPENISRTPVRGLCSKCRSCAYLFQVVASPVTLQMSVIVTATDCGN
jgi:hypothetical protein